MENQDEAQRFQQLENIVKQYLNKEALLRYGNIKAAHPQKALQIITILAQLIENQQLNEKLTNEQFKNLLLNLTEKKEFRITRK
ncbi:MAG: hypothetical protein KJ674_03990 [Nanoarchaeota archaeon]|nr:hypothetical protein [Nanoarchaeota archaeon]